MDKGAITPDPVRTIGNVDTITGRGKGKRYEVLDTLGISLTDPKAAVISISVTKPSLQAECDLLVAGGGMGGVAATIQALRSGLTVCLTEETDWLGGQMTTQGVSALDENRLVETSGATATYQKLRFDIRNHYRTRHQLAPNMVNNPHLNPGRSWVTRLSFEPMVALNTLEQWLNPFIESGQLRVFYRMKPVCIRKSGRHIKSVTMVNLDHHSIVEFHPKICVDATELGELLPLAKIPYRVGSDSRSDTGEPHAPDVGDPENVQDFVFPFVVEFHHNQEHTIPKPPHYDEFKATNKFSFNGYKMFTPAKLVDADGRLSHLLPFWSYRRLIDKHLLSDFTSDIAMINWDSNDLKGRNIIDKEPAIMAEHLALAKSLSLGFLYWLQTEAPRDEGGQGYPEIKLRLDSLGTGDGLSKYPYIREARRMCAKKLIVEQDIAESFNPSARARLFPDSVGIGHYPIDIHGQEAGPGVTQPTRPFQIPLGALIPEKIDNLLPGSKNFGTTHITNGAYRLHPIEWATGEAVGALSGFCLEHNVSPARVLANKSLLHEFQKLLVERGIPIFWYSDVATTHPGFAAIQYLSTTGVMSGSPHTLHFHPDHPMTRGETVVSLSHLMNLKVHPIDHNRPAATDIDPNHPLSDAIKALTDRKLFSLDNDSRFHPDNAVKWQELQALSKLLKLSLPHADDTVLTRRDFACWIYPAATRKETIR